MKASTKASVDATVLAIIVPFVLTLVALSTDDAILGILAGMSWGILIGAAIVVRRLQIRATEKAWDLLGVDW
jgi:hypothetical protein